ncbi:SMI1/KNR4 family protein [Sphingobacterium bambusae]|uniref:SMI1/KNR4 family protein n=1 Tax=Sphingobacterium bambusae TaxID=662858 RepID=A0ABW6BBM8_9SPHI|nr:SMI1/KNR4 family protein [Sphingobacterium bambusae]WPL48865.1 SMI1/KNR4 family protein [Sphingobacterium bambusae]
MNHILRELDSFLSSLRPTFYSDLNSPLDDAELDKLEADYAIKLPNDLRALYKWKNGQKESCYASFVNNSVFLPLDQVLDTAAELTSMIGYDFEIDNWWNAHWLPIFQNGGGDSICYDLKGIFTGQKGQILEFWHADNDRNVIAPSLEAFFNKIVKYYATKQKEEFDEFFTVEKIPEYPKRFILT